MENQHPALIADDSLLRWTASNLVNDSEEKQSDRFNQLSDILNIAADQMKSVMALNNQDELNKLLKILYNILIPFRKLIPTELSCKPIIEQLESSLKEIIIKTSDSQKTCLANMPCFFLLLECSSGDQYFEEVINIFEQISNTENTTDEIKLRKLNVALGIINTKLNYISDCFHLELNSDWNEISISYVVYKEIGNACLQSNLTEIKGLKVLTQWLKKMSFSKINATILTEKQHHCCVCKNDIYQKIINIDSKNPISAVQIVNKNWENQAKGASTLLLECIRSLLKLNTCCINRASTFTEIFLENVVNSGWNTKKIFLQLQLSIEFLHPMKVFDSYPEIPMKLLNGLESTAVNTYCTDVYKSIISRISSNEWLRLFQPVFRKALNTKNKHMQYNLLKLWIPCTLHQKPEVFNNLITLIEIESNGLLSKLFILSHARTEGLLNIGHYEFNNFFTNLYEFEYNILPIKNYNNKKIFPFFDDIISGIFHERNDIRSECFALLVNTRTFSEPISMFESNLIKIFIIDNFNIASSSFRMSLFKSFTFLCKRLLSLMMIGIRNDPNKYLRFTKTETFELTNISGTFDICIDLFYWLLYAITDSLIFAGSYQRKVTALNFYGEVLCLFYHTNGLTNKRTEPLLKYFLKWTKITLITKDTVSLLLSYCMDESEKVRAMALDLVYLISAQQYNLDSNIGLLWLRKAFVLCNSPEANSSESGAFLLTAVRALSRNFDGILSNFSIELELTTKYNGNTLLALLFQILESHLSKAKHNLLKSSNENPMHGIILAINSTLLSEENYSNCRSGYVTGFIRKLFSLYQDIVYFALDCLRPSGFQKELPSFAEMDEAVKERFLDCFCKENYSESNIEDTMEKGTQMIVSCCWLCMKACCLSVASIVEKFLKIMDTDLINVGIKDILIYVLSYTRHKGAVEAASLALSHLSRVINSTENGNVHREFLKLQLKKIICKMDTVFDTSLTRRAAGLAMIFSSTCESSQTLSLYVAQNLFDVIVKNADQCSSVTDSPAVVSIHSLRAMMLNSRISSYLTPLYSHLMDICLNGFDSTQWVMRNASLQLFGTLVTSLVGQKIEKEDTGIFNSISVTDFMFRHEGLIQKLSLSMICHNNLKEFISNDVYTDLKDIFACKTEQSQSGRKQFKIHCSTLPILSLLSRLDGCDDNSVVVNNLRLALIPCLTHPVWTVRRLCAVCIVKLSPKSKIPTLITKILSLIQHKPSIIRCNLMHGLLFCISFSIDYYPSVRLESNFLTILQKTLENFKVNPVLNSLFASICSRVGINLNLSLHTNVSSNLGINEWHYFLSKATGNELTEILKASLNSGDSQYIDNVIDYLSESYCPPSFLEYANTLCECYDLLSDYSKSAVINILVKYLDKEIITTDILSDTITSDMMSCLKIPEFSDLSLTFAILFSYYIKCNYLKLTDNCSVQLWLEIVSNLGKMTADEQHKMTAGRCLTVMLPLFDKLDSIQKVLPVCLNLLHDENECIRSQVATAVKQTVCLENKANSLTCARALVIYSLRSAFYNNRIDVIHSLFQFCDTQLEFRNVICLYQSDIRNTFGELMHTGKFISNVLLHFPLDKYTFSPDFKNCIFNFVSNNNDLFRNKLVDEIIPSEYCLMDKTKQLNIAIRINCLRFLINLNKLFDLHL